MPLSRLLLLEGGLGQGDETRGFFGKHFEVDRALGSVDEPDDMIVWDNWRVCHATQGVPIDVPRLATRTTIKGDYNVGRYLDPELDREREVVRFMD